MSPNRGQVEYTQHPAEQLKYMSQGHSDCGGPNSIQGLVAIKMSMHEENY